MSPPAAYDRWLTWVLSFVQRLGVPVRDSQDITHEVFLVFLRKFSHVSDPNEQRPLLAEIARNIVVNYHRKRKEELTVDDHQQPEPRSPDFGEEVCLLDLLKRLPERERLVFVLHRLQGMTMKEVAQQIQSREPQSLAIYKSAVRHLTDLLEVDAA